MTAGTAMAALQVVARVPYPSRGELNFTTQESEGAVPLSAY